jgi:lysozyme
MKTSQAGIDLIKSFEGCKLRAYQDSVGIWTIGVGHTGPDVCAGVTVSDQEAISLLQMDLHEAEEAVDRLVTAPLNQNEFDALVSFTFNLGEGNLKKSTLLKYLNQMRYEDAANEFPRWNRAGGQILPGLTRRREAEKRLFLEAI